MSGHASAGLAALVGVIATLIAAAVEAAVVALLGGVVVVSGQMVVLLIVGGALFGLMVWAVHEWALHPVGSAARRDYRAPAGGTTPPRPHDPDWIVAEADQAFRDGLIDRAEFDRRVREAYGYES